MGGTVRTSALPFKRHQPGSPYLRLAQELGYAKEKTARDNVARPYLQVAITNRILLDAGRPEKVGELMGVVTASLMGEGVPDVADAIYRSDCADADEDRAQADFIRTRGDAELGEWIRKLGRELHTGEQLMARLIMERDGRASR